MLPILVVLSALSNRHDRNMHLFTEVFAVLAGHAPVPHWPVATVTVTMRLPALAFLLAAALAAQSGGVNRPDQRQKPYVVLVSFDGRGAQLLDRSDAPNFQRVLRHGVRAKSLIPVFPSTTFPNHYTIVTGLYPENHGVVEMNFFDPVRGKSYSYQSQENVLDGSWYRGEPIWVTAEKQGMVAAACYWPGSEAEILGVRPSHWRKYADNLSNRARVETVLDWLRMPPESRPHLITLYFGDVDSAGHRFGLESPVVRQPLQRVDQSLGSLLTALSRFRSATGSISSWCPTTAWPRFLRNRSYPSTASSILRAWSSAARAIG